jgi:hypothetical protein
MAQSKFTLYKYLKLGDGSWRYKKAMSVGITSSCYSTPWAGSGSSPS